MNLRLGMVSRLRLLTGALLWAVCVHAQAAEESAPVTRQELREGMWAYFGPGPFDAEAVDPELEILEKRDMGDRDCWVLRYRLHEDDPGHAYYKKRLAEAGIPGYPPPQVRAMAYTWMEDRLEVARRTASGKPSPSPTE